MLALKAELKGINDQNIGDLQVFRNGKEVRANPKALEMWRFTGLNNADFLLLEVFSEGEGPEETVWEDTE